MLLRSLSTVLAQDHFYSDFLSLLLTKQIHFESVMMIASAQHSLSVLASVKLMIECVVQLLSRFPSYSYLLLIDVFWRLWERATSEQLLCYRRAISARLPCPSHNPPFCMRDILCKCASGERRECFALLSGRAALNRLIIPSRPFGYDQV